MIVWIDTKIPSLPGYRLILLCHPPGVHVVPAPLLCQLLRDHGVDALLKAAVVLPERLNVDHRVDHGSLIHLTFTMVTFSFQKSTVTFLIAAIFWFSAKFPTASTPCRKIVRFASS